MLKILIGYNISYEVVYQILVCMERDDTVRDEIRNILNEVDKVYAGFIFGSYGSDEFTDKSDIDIAIVGELELVDKLKLENTLTKELKREVDLVVIDELPQYLQLQILVRNDNILIKDEEKYFEYLDKINRWYKFEFDFWKKSMIERGHFFD